MLSHRWGQAGRAPEAQAPAGPWLPPSAENSDLPSRVCKSVLEAGKLFCGGLAGKPLGQTKNLSGGMGWLSHL